MADLRKLLTTVTPINPDSISIKKRRNIEFLPAIFQTDVLKKVFSASIDHLYQPQETEELVGYIGDITSFYDSIRDFYIPEINNERTEYQLVPTYISKDLETNEVQSHLYYQDLKNYIRFKGGITNDHNRLFNQEYYSWCPPIDIDKFMNYRDYYWLPNGYTPYVITSNSNLSQFVGNATGIITVDGVDLQLSSGMIILPLEDSNIEYKGKVLIVEGVGRSIYFVVDENATGGWDLSDWDITLWDESGDNFLTPNYITMERGCWDKNNWSRSNRWFHRDVIQNFYDPLLEKKQASRPIIEFERDLELWNHGTLSRGRIDLAISDCPNFYKIVQGLSPGWDDTVWDPCTEVEGNPCVPSLGCDITLSRPREDISGYIYRSWDVEWSLSDLGYSEVYIKDDFGNLVQLRDGMRILLRDDQDPSADNKIVEVNGIAINGRITLQFINNGSDPLGRPVYGERVYLKNSSGQTKNYWFNGFDWVDGQVKDMPNQAPRFMLYDIDGNKLNDQSIYPNSNFDTMAGNTIFEYKIDIDSDSQLDQYLGLRLSRNQYDEILFKNTLFNTSYFYEDTITKDTKEIKGYYFYKIARENDNESVFSNNWHLVPEESKQYSVQTIKTIANVSEYTLTVLPELEHIGNNSPQSDNIIVKLDGKELNYGVDYLINIMINSIVLLKSVKNNQILKIYVHSKESSLSDDSLFSIPINLAANPTNEELDEVGFNQLFEQFYSIIDKQTELIGSSFNRNNYRDTGKKKYLGDKILQHSAPMTYLMSLVSENDLDLIDAIKYSEREYIRFKNKLIQKITHFLETNTLSPLETNIVGGVPETTGNTPSEWLDLAIKEINIAKTNDFPFKNTGMGSVTNSDKFFIPPTTAFLGLTGVYKPEFYTDSTFDQPVTFLQGHDGSFTPIFGDFRDEVLFEYENKIFNSILDKFKSEKLPIVSKYDILPGKFRKTDYTSDEVIRVAKPNFEVWAAQAGVNYNSNTDEMGENAFALNYGKLLDKDGDKIPGNYRGIYEWYYDTDRPHTHPWEMLGFTIKPNWWDDEYGIAPYTSGNTKLWDDLEKGLIRQGERIGVDERFARPGLHKVIPVSTTGDLLPPYEAGVVNKMPLESEAISDWVFGDVGPIETAWKKSEFYNYDLIQLLFLLKPAKVCGLGWDTNEVDFIQLNDNSDKQYIFNSYKLRPKPSKIVVHDESYLEASKYHEDFNVVNNLVRSYGLIQFISNYLEYQGKNITNHFGDIIRGSGVQLGHKVAGFIDHQTSRLDGDSFGRVPTENIKILQYKSKSIKEVFYGGMIIERTAKGYRLYGYDLINPSFTIIPGDVYGRKTTIGIGNRGNPFEVWQSNKQYYRTEVVYYELNKQYYICSADHRSSESLDAQYWTKISKPPSQYQVQVFKYLDQNPEGRTEKILYGTEFQTVQEVFNVIIDYERYLKSEGFIFDQYSSDANDIIDWTWSGKEFLSWTLLNNLEGDIISLSPGAQQLRFKTNFGHIEPIEQIIQGVYSILNRDGGKIEPKNTAVSRFDGLLEVIPTNPTNPETLIYSMRLFLTEIEHSILVDNKTIFNDIIYDPLFNIRQKRLRLSAVRARGWRGRYDAPGFIISENRLIPNYDKLADQFRYIFDINNNQLVEKDWRSYGYHNIGYQNRSYLDQLIISEKSQLNFYQGMIREKGTRSSFNRLLRSEFITKTSDLFFHEEWAFRIGMYGDYDKKPTLEISLTQESANQNPQRIDFDLVDIPDFVEKGDILPTTPTSDKIYFYNKTENQLYKWGDKGYVKISDWSEIFELAYRDNAYDDVTQIYTIKDEEGKIIAGDDRWIRRPDTTISYLNDWIWPLRDSEFGNIKELPNSGYAHLDEADYYAFNGNSLLNLYDQERSSGRFFVDGERIWLYETNGIHDFYNPNTYFSPNVSRGATKFSNSWSMFRLSRLKDVNITGVQITEDRDEIIISFNTAISYFNYSGDSTFVSGNNLSSSDLQNIIFSNNIPSAGSATTLTDNNYIVVEDGLLYEVSATTVTTVDVSIMSIPLSASPLSALTTVNVPADTSSTSVNETTTIYVTSSSMVTVTKNTIITTTVSVNPTDISADFVSLAGQIDTTCTFKPAFSSNIFITGSEPTPINIEDLIFISDNTDDRENPPPSTDSFNILDINDIITIQVRQDNIHEIEGTFIVKEILSPTQIIVAKPDNLYKDFSEDDLVDIEDDTDIFVYKECKFRNIEEFLAITNSISYSDRFFNSFDDQIFYIDDARTDNEKLIIEPYYEVLKITDWAEKSYDVTRKQNKKVNTEKLYNAVLYNSDTGKTILDLEIYDPYKGIIPGIADKEIWYKLDYDPAKYTNGDRFTHNINDEQAWGINQVGRVWWDLSTLKYLNYESGSNSYRRDNWGKLAPGSNIDIYEWTRSSTPPLNYQVEASNNTNIPGGNKSNVPSGQIFKPQSPAYCQHQEYDPKSGSLKTYYYFWVKNKITIPDVGFRTISTQTITNIITDPTKAGIRWFSPININSVLISNVYEYIGYDSSVLQVNWNLATVDGNWHKQWILGRDGDPNWIPDSILYDKMIDSLIGFDKDNKIVPDPSLNKIEKSGILVRPRQSMFVNLVKAKSNYIEYFNYLLEKVNYLDRLDALKNIHITEPEPTSDFIVDSFEQRDFLADTNIVGIGETVLVNKNPDLLNFWSLWKLIGKNPSNWSLVQAQTYDTSEFIKITDWYSDEVDKNNPPTKIVNTLNDLNQSIIDGIIIQDDIFIINNTDSSGLWEWRRFEGGDEFTTLAKQSSTILISDSLLSNKTLYGVNESWSNLTLPDLFDKIKNRDGTLELRELLKAFRYKENTLTIEEVNKTFFNMIRYAFSENQVIDWAFKSSYILFGGTIESLGQEEIIRPTLFDSLINYISEVKPYHVKFREFARRIATAIDIYSTNVTDFDLPLYYDPIIRGYRRLDVTNNNDLNIIQNNKPWSDWYENYLNNNHLIRNFKITEKFDRVSCSPSDLDPSSIKIFSDGRSSAYNLIVNNASIITSPTLNDYSVFKGPVGPDIARIKQIWDTQNIIQVSIKDNFNGKISVLSKDRWRIIEDSLEIIISEREINKYIKIKDLRNSNSQDIYFLSRENIQDYIKSYIENGELEVSLVSSSDIGKVGILGIYRLLIDDIPPAGNIIEITRRMTAADRIERYYNPITTLWNGNHVNHIIPEKKSIGLISGCEYMGTINEGGNYKLVSSDFQAVRINYLGHIWDFRPNYEFWYDNIAPESIKDDNSKPLPGIPESITASASSKFIDFYKRDYSWDSKPWDGYGGVSENITLPSYTSAENILYDIIVSGIPTEVSATAWGEINSPLATTIEGNKFIQPELGNRPEELVLFNIPDTLLLDVYSQDTPGAPRVYQYKENTVIRTGDAWKLPGLAQSREAIFVYVNGLLLTENESYTINWNDQTIEFLVNFSQGSNQLVINVYTTGGSSILYTKFFKIYQGLANNLYDLAPDLELLPFLNKENIFATVNGYIVDVINIEYGVIELNLGSGTFFEDDTVIIHIFANDNIALIRREDFIITSATSTLSLTYLSGPEEPIEQSILVFNNGLRKMGPIYRYFEGDALSDTFDTGLVLSSLNKVKILIDGILVTNWVIDPSESTSVKLNFIPDFGSKIIIAISDYSIYELLDSNLELFDTYGFDENEYEVGGVGQNLIMSLTADLPKPSVFSVITFNNNSSFGIKTEFFKGRSDSTYELSKKPYNQHNIWASVEEKNTTFTQDYELIVGTKDNDLYIYNSSRQAFLSSLIVWDNFYDDKINFTQIRFKETHYKEYVPTEVLDFSKIGFDSDDWDDDINATGWDNETPVVTILSDSPGFDNASENVFDVEKFDSIDQTVVQNDVYLTYMTGVEKIDSIAFRIFNSDSGDTEFARISESHKMILKTDISADTTSFDVYENISLLPALNINTPLMVPNLSENVPGIIWVNGERIKYWNIFGPTVTSGKRYWSISNIERGCSSTSDGVPYEKEYVLLTSDGSATEFEIDNLADYDFTVSMINYIQYPGMWQNKSQSNMWDTFEWDSTPERNQDIPLYRTENGLEGEYSVSGNKIIFRSPPGIDPLSPTSITFESGNYEYNTIFLENILVTKTISNWVNSKLVHRKGSLVISGSNNLNIPGGIDFNYNQNITGSLLGLQNQDTIQLEFLQNKVGRINKP